MIKRGRYVKISDAKRVFGEHALTTASQKMIPLMADNDTYIRDDEKPLRFYNRLKLNTGDKIEVRLNDWSRENYVGTVIKEYDTYYLIEKERGRYDTIHKVCEFTTVRVIRDVT